jgi:tyrosine-protein phosphatase SIW14
LPVAAEQPARPIEWATPVQSQHLKNFYRLDEKVYRSAQPDRKGFQELKAFDIANMLSFRDHHADDKDAKGLGLALHRVKMEAGEIKDEQVARALRIIRTAKGPIVIHCLHGSDRTGLVSALYRILYQNWSKDEAIEGLMKGGYRYHSRYRNIPEYIRKVNIEELRRVVEH